MKNTVTWTRADVEKVFPNQPEVVDRYMQTIASINAGNANSEDAALVNALSIMALANFVDEQGERLDNTVFVVKGLTVALRKLTEAVIDLNARVKRLEESNG